MKTLLVVGSTGVIGEAVTARFLKRPDWQVIAVSRRATEIVGAGVRHVLLDLGNEASCRAAAPQFRDVTHVVYTAVAELPGLVEGWRDRDQMQTNLRMLSNLFAPLVQVAANLTHVTLLQGAKAYGGHVGHLAPLPARESAPRDTHENFYWLQEDYIREAAQASGFAWTIFRPAVVVGGAWGAAMNPLLPLGAYGALRREEGRGFSFPGGALQISEIVDADLLAEAFEWAAGSPAANGETFNITNGDVFAWREAWPALAEAFGFEVERDEPMSLAHYLAGRTEAWTRLVERYGLRQLTLTQFLGESHHYADLLLRKDAPTIGRPNLLSTIKLRQAGFGPCRDSEEVIRRWVRQIQARRLLPPT